MPYLVITVLVTLFVVGVWLGLPSHGQVQLERGKYLVEVLAACGNCHTPKGANGEIGGKHLAGGLEIREPFGVAVASNITPDPDTGLGRWSDGEVIRAIRDGKGRDGRVLGPPMPFHLYRRLSDRDVQAIVDYLRTVPPVRNAVGPSRYTIPLIGSDVPPSGQVSDPDRTNLVQYGEYLAGPVAHCIDCHTPRGADGRPDSARLGAGGTAFRGPWGTSYAANLTVLPTVRSSPRSTALGAMVGESCRRCRPRTMRPGSPRRTSGRSWPTCAHSGPYGTRSLRRRAATDRAIRSRSSAWRPALVRRAAAAPVSLSC
jgi:mono/diheme cytochrome c family protein